MIARCRRAVTVLACLFGVFGALLVLVLCRYQPLVHGDRSVVVALHSVAVRHPGWTVVMRTTSRVGAPLTWFTVLVPVFVLLIRMQRFRLAAWVGASAAGSPVLNSVVKTSVHRARPALADPVASAAGWSFPSGHAQAATVGCLVLAVLSYPLVRRPMRGLVVALAVTIASLIAFSRVALAVHYPSDVVAGSALGASWVLLMAVVIGGLRRSVPAAVSGCCRGAPPAVPGRNAPAPERD